jgi:hypothetical protein
MNKSQNLKSVSVVSITSHLSQFILVLGVVLLLTSAILLLRTCTVYATSQASQPVSFTLEDRDRLIRLETSLKEFKEAVDKRFEAMDKRIDQLFAFLWIITGIFTSITIATISFAVWDRRTMVRPFEAKVKETELRIEEIDKGKIEKLILSLREIAKTDKKIEEILKKVNLL